FVIPMLLDDETSTTQIYPLSLHDALPISDGERRRAQIRSEVVEHLPGHERLAPDHGFELHREPADHVEVLGQTRERADHTPDLRSEEHTSELQSRENIVCRLLLEKKNTQ